MYRLSLRLLTAAALSWSISSQLSAAEELHTFGDTSTVYATGVTIPAGWPQYVTAGTTAGANAGKTVKMQAMAALLKLQENITTAGYKMQDVVYVRAYLATGTRDQMDLEGWNEAWSLFFGNARNPHKPARTTVAVPLLGRPETLIEIEFVCAAPPKSDQFASSDKLGLPVSNPVLKPYGTKEARIYNGMGTRADTAYYWSSGTRGTVPSAAGAASLGNMKAQAHAALVKLKADLAAVGLSYKDVIFLRAFLGPDKPGANEAKYDLDGWNAAYDEFFNNAENPHKPARTTVTTPRFEAPGPLVEVEVVAAFPDQPSAVSFLSTGPNPHIKALGAPTAAIASGVATDRASSMFWAAGTGPKVGGNLKAQALSAFASLGERLTAAGLGFKDVIFLRLYLVPDKDGSLDLTARDEAYRFYFNNEKNPQKPARTTIAVSALARPDWKIEIDAVAVAP